MEYRCEGGGASLAGLARGACQPRLRGACGMSCGAREGRLPTSLRRSGARYPHPPRRIRRRRATRSRRLDCPRRVRVANQGGTHSGTVPAGRGSRGGSRGGTAGTRGAGLVFGKTRIALLANFWLTRAPGRAFGGRAAVARLPKSIWPLYVFLAQYYLYSFSVFFPYSCPKQGLYSSGGRRGPPEAPCAAPQCGNGAPALRVAQSTDFPI